MGLSKRRHKTLGYISHAFAQNCSWADFRRIWYTVLFVEIISCDKFLLLLSFTVGVEIRQSPVNDTATNYDAC